MNQNIDQFDRELAKLIERFRREYEITYAEVIGVMQIRQCLLVKEAAGAEE